MSVFSHPRVFLNTFMVCAPAGSSTPCTSTPLASTLLPLMAFKFVQGVLSVLKLIVHHDVHHLLHITINIIATYAVLYGCKQAFHFLLAQSVQIAVVHQHTSKVCDTFHGGHVCQRYARGSLPCASRRGCQRPKS